MYNLTHTLQNGATITEPIYNHNDFPYTEVATNILSLKRYSSRMSHYVGDFGTFDIETSSYISGHHVVRKNRQNEVIPDYNAFMYCWQFCLAGKVVMGRDWNSFNMFLKKLSYYLRLKEDGNHLVIYVHNLSYEFQFIRNFFHVTNIFAIEKRKVIRCVLDGIFELRCSYKLTNMALEKFLANSKNVTHYKKTGALDYSKLRTPSTKLTDEELSYCYCDVAGLREGICQLLTSENDTLSTVPLTSTGYVRREFRSASNSNPKNYFIFKALQLKPLIYGYLKQATRGGNCHANPHLSNKVWEEVGSEDMSSAYPAVMTQCKFPMSPFVKRRPDLQLLDSLIASNEFALLMHVDLENLEIKVTKTIPYISKAKCTRVLKPRIDNGRVLESPLCSMVITDIDYRIIKQQYNFKLHIKELYQARYDYLPIELRQKIVEQYRSKCELKFGDPYLYNKYKNKINADFGMMLTDICRPEILYNPHDSIEPFVKSELDVPGSIARYYKSQNSFLSYQWGVWVTAHCRRRLQRAIDLVGVDALYCDTDSLKFLTDIDDHEKDFELLNNEILKEAEQCQLLTSCDVLNPETNEYEHFQLGVWEKEKTYETFKTLGAKKYAYTYKDKPGEFFITVAGLSKTSGAEYLGKHGGMERFDDSTIIPAQFSGRTTAFYRDVTKPYYITINGEKILTASAIALVPTSYTFSLTSEYQTLLAELEAPLL